MNNQDSGSFPKPELKDVDITVVEIALGRHPVANEIIEIADGHTFQISHVTPYRVFLKEVEVH